MLPAIHRCCSDQSFLNRKFIKGASGPFIYNPSGFNAPWKKKKCLNATKRRERHPQRLIALMLNVVFNKLVAVNERLPLHSTYGHSLVSEHRRRMHRFVPDSLVSIHLLLSSFFFFFGQFNSSTHNRTYQIWHNVR